ncbi:MAG: glycosyltransferase family 2 protein [Rhodospirillales bacterium]|nr:glycosyltransferase family 2 protein [Rhodospirillales bacterium]
MPTRSRASLLRRALIGVQAQTLPDKEIVVVDDASTDETRAMLAAEFAHRRPLARLRDRRRGGRARPCGLGGGRTLRHRNSDPVSRSEQPAHHHPHYDPVAAPPVR